MYIETEHLKLIAHLIVANNQWIRAKERVEMESATSNIKAANAIHKKVKDIPEVYFTGSKRPTLESIRRNITAFLPVDTLLLNFDTVFQDLIVINTNTDDFKEFSEKVKMKYSVTI